MDIYLQTKNGDCFLLDVLFDVQVHYVRIAFVYLAIGLNRYQSLADKLHDCVPQFEYVRFQMTNRLQKWCTRPEYVFHYVLSSIQR
jgi:hypothetical protein